MEKKAENRGAHRGVGSSLDEGGGSSCSEENGIVPVPRGKVQRKGVGLSRKLCYCRFETTTSSNQPKRES